MIGDSWLHDVVGATAPGIRALWLNRNGAAIPTRTLRRRSPHCMPTAETAALIAPRKVRRELRASHAEANAGVRIDLIDA